MISWERNAVGKIKVKVKLRCWVRVTPCILNLDSRWRWVVGFTSWLLHPRCPYGARLGAPENRFGVAPSARNRAVTLRAASWRPSRFILLKDETRYGNWPSLTDSMEQSPSLAQLFQEIPCLIWKLKAYPSGMLTGSSFFGGKAAGPWSWPLASIWRWGQCAWNLEVWLHGVHRNDCALASL